MSENSTFKDILDFSSQHNALLRYPDSTDFKSVTRGAAQNEVWRDTTSETLWDILSACGKDINNIVSNAAIDYVQNISDINTARIPALVNMGSMLKYETGSLLEIYNIMPNGLQLLLDVLSIDREYLFGGDSPILNVPLVRKLMEKMKVGLMRLVDRTYLETMALEDVFTEVKRNSHRVDEEAYYGLIKELFYELILDVLTARYSESDDTTLIDNLLYAELNSYERQDAIPRNTVLDKMIRGESRHPLDLEGTAGSSISLDPSIKVSEGETYSSLAEQIEALRRTYNVSHSFNPWVIADQINEHGFSPNNELTDNEKILVETVLFAHNKERFDYAKGCYLLGKVDSRYGYYREKEFVKYLKAFLIMHSLKVQAVNLDVTTLNLVGINVINEQDTCVLDLFTYVNKKWEYNPEQPAEKEIPVDQYGVGRAIVLEPIGMKDGKAFIPRVQGDMESLVIETRGYDYIESYHPTAETEWHRSIDLEKHKPDDILDVIADKLTELVFKIHAMRNEMKRQAQFNAMRGTGSLLAHSINDFLLTKYPTEQFDVVPRWSDKKSYDGQMKAITDDDSLDELEKLRQLSELQALITESVRLFRNYTNVDIIEYMDTTEYFNIHPTGLYTNDEVLLDSRYWEQLSKAITNRDKAQLGVFSPNEIREFYRNKLSMGSLHSSTEVEDDIEEFLLSLYETGATDTYYDEETGNLIHPINDVTNEDNLFAYESKSDRMKVQNNEELIAKQDKQFLRYSSNTDLLGENRNRHGNGQVIEAFNWKNTNYASVMLHPFMYTFQLWNPLVNILINAMSEYITSDLERNLTNKKIFDELYGKDGESKDFWKYNVLDFTGYVTRYEHERHDKTDAIGETSPLTGYDGLFYPSAIKEFIDAYNRTKWEIDRFAIDGGTEKGKNLRAVRDFTPRYTYPKEDYGVSIFISNDEFEAETKKSEADKRLDAYDNMAYRGDVAYDDVAYEDIPDPPDPGETFEQMIASIYWQIEFKRKDGETVSKIGDLHTADYLTYYGKWFAHLGYSDERCKHIAKQLWYWRDRIVDAATHRYAVCNYNLDLGNNSMFLMDTFTNELKDGADEERNYAIEALDASLIATNNYIERSINENRNTTAGRCFTPINRPKELWIRWNAEPIALPAFDVYWNNEQLPDRWYDESVEHDKQTSLGSAGRFQEFGQIKYKDSTTNDAISDVIEQFLHFYKLDGSGVDMKKGNKAPIFYSFQQNADVLAFAAWQRLSDEDSMLAGYDRTALCPVHILCREVQADDGSYLFERFLQDTPTLDPIGKTASDSHLSAPYIFDAAGGNLLLPTYRIHTPKSSDDPDDPNNAENATVRAEQVIFIKLYGLSCQSVVRSNYETREKLMVYEERSIFINADNLFSGTVLISNGTSVLFSLDGEKLGMAFLGNLTSTALDIVSKTLAGGCTRYMADSDPQEKIALLRKKFYQVKGDYDEVAKRNVKNYADLRISDAEIVDEVATAKNIWNSFDRNDKFVCVVQYDGALDPGVWALEAKNSSKFSSRLLNLVSDASYIPEFAYQSPKDFNRFPEVSGTTYLHQATYFNLRDHWAIQLLGLENNLMLDFVKIAQDLIVRDETDNVDTYVNPGQVVDAIYRIWEQSDLTEENLGIERLYNPKLVFDPVTKSTTWTEQWVVNEEGKEAFLKRHLSIVRCNENKDGEILNEKNWVLKTIAIKEIVDDLSKQNPDGDGFRKVSLDDFYTVALENEGHSCNSTSHILVGTQDPYKYSTDPDWATTLRSPAYLLQYGNGIAGARRCEVGVFIDKRKENEEVLPYDAEVEYIKSTGIQHIDTGVVGSTPARVKIKFSISPNCESNNSLFGAFSADNRVMIYITKLSNGKNRIQVGCGTATARDVGLDAEDDSIHEIVVNFEADNLWAEVDGGTRTTISGATSATNSLNLLLFNRSGNLNSIKARIYSATIWSGSNMELTRDYVPVRVGTEYCLYDRANPTGGDNGDGLYHNKGLGVFYGGEDVVKTKSRVEATTQSTQSLPSREDAPYVIRIEVRLFKEDDEVRDRASDEINTYMDSIDVIPPKCLLMAVSEDEVEHLADYHMLVHHNDIFYNIPHNNQDDILRSELPPHERERYWKCPTCNYVYDGDSGPLYTVDASDSIKKKEQEDEEVAKGDEVFVSFHLDTPLSTSVIGDWSIQNMPENTKVYASCKKVPDGVAIIQELATCTEGNGTQSGTFEFNKSEVDEDLDIKPETEYEVHVYCEIPIIPDETVVEGEENEGVATFETLACDPRLVKTAMPCPNCSTSGSKFSLVVDPDSLREVALEAKDPPKSFLDYLYIYEGSAAFKINEQSDKFCTFNWEHPTAELDKLLYNFRKNQVDLNCLYPWSTYVTQEHNPKLPHITSVEMETVTGTDCRGVEEFNRTILPIGNLVVDVRENIAPDTLPPPVWHYEVQPGDSTTDILNKMIDAGYSIHTWEAAGNDELGGGSVVSIDVSNDDFDSTYKIYANYQKVDDEDDPRGYHFDLFFNIQNLFKPPFEYMSKVTHQPAPHILPNSYLYLPGDKGTRLEGSGGQLTLYAQMKWLVNDITAAVKTLPLVTYDIYNISDDKPKFLIKRTKDLTQVRPAVPKVFLKFEDVYIDGADVQGGMPLVNEQGVTTRPVEVVQAVSVHYNNDISSEFNRLASLKFNIVQNDSVPIATSDGDSEEPPTIDLDKTKAFFSFPPNADLAVQGSQDRPYPVRFNDIYSSMGKEKRGYSVAYTYQDSGYTNEDLYLYWTIPAGLNVARAIQTIGCVVEDTAIKCVAKMKSGDEAMVVVQPGHIYMDSIAGNVKYLGREHGKHLNKFGYVLTKVSSELNKIRLSPPKENPGT